jgi:hypothetical protein
MYGSYLFLFLVLAIDRYCSVRQPRARLPPKETKETKVSDPPAVANGNDVDSTPSPSARADAEGTEDKANPDDAADRRSSSRGRTATRAKEATPSKVKAGTRRSARHQ